MFAVKRMSVGRPTRLARLIEPMPGEELYRQGCSNADCYDLLCRKKSYNFVVLADAAAEGKGLRHGKPGRCLDRVGRARGCQPGGRDRRHDGLAAPSRAGEQRSREAEEGALL